MPPKKVVDCEKVNKDLHPKTLKCVNKCNPGKSRNINFRCVNTKSNTAKKKPSQTKKPASTKKKKPKVNVIIDCEQFNQVLNPHTLKCVDKCKADEERDAHFNCVKIVFPEPAIDDPNITKNETTDILNLINKYASEGEKYQNEGIEYKTRNNMVLHNLLYLYLIEKYGSNCFVRAQYVKGSYTYDGIRLKGNMSNHEKAEEKRGIYKQIKVILNCIKKIQDTNEEIIVIPLTVEYENNAHANMLIYRKSSSVIEQFEPHGATFLGPKKHKITDYIQSKVPVILETIVNKMNTINKENNHAYYKNNITYIRPYDVCPTGEGFQALENNLVIPSKVRDKEGGGFCAIWSIFWAEMVLLNPRVSSEDLRDYIMESLNYYDINKSYLEIALKTRNVIRGYLEFIVVQINNMLEDIAPGRNMNNLLTNAYREPQKVYNNWLDQIIGNLDSYYNISYHLFGKLNQPQQKNKFNEYLDTQFKKYNDLSYTEYIQKPASKSFSSLSL
jgi:hypothetical protein